MLLLNKIKNFISINTQEIIISELKPFPSITAHDELIIKLADHLIQTIPFEIARENISIEEQVRWQINSVLEKPLEQYILSYQVHFEDSQKILGIAALLEKDVLETILQSPGSKNITKVYSSDQQYNFYQKQIPFWEMNCLINKLKTVSQIFLIIFIPMLFLAQGSLNKQMNQEKHNFSMLNPKATILQKQFNQYQEQQNFQATTKLNKDHNAKIYKLILEATRKTPPEINFTQLNYQTNGNLEITGTTTKDLRFISKYQNKLIKMPGIKTVLLERSAKDKYLNFTLLLVPKETKGKTKNV